MTHDRPKIGEHDVGDTVLIESEIDFNLPFQDPQAADPGSTSITITDYEGNTVEQDSLSKNADGEFFYEWDTSGLSPGDYDVDIEASQNGKDEVDTGFIRLN